MKIVIVSREKESINELKEEILDIDDSVKIVEKDPDIVISYGGDGTFLVAERLFPSIPKLLLRKSSICKLCEDGNTYEIIKRVIEGKIIKNIYPKLEAKINSRLIPLKSINDIIIRNKNQYESLRFDTIINDQTMQNIIGDGVVISTPFGSTGYFYSITRKNFEKGIGIAFNNPTSHQDYIIKDDLNIKIKISRGEAIISFDNIPEIHESKEGDIIEIFTSKENFTTIRVKSDKEIS
ncbi:MAG: hypothetical protein Q7S74_04900 [Nanoarchaeota archaeon]|nr:hypothetical protein [Nanoarchaeota archaeon]